MLQFTFYSKPQVKQNKVHCFPEEKLVYSL